MKTLDRKYSIYLIDALKQEVLSRETEIDAIRSSLRYRIGGWALEAWPPSRRTLIVIARTLVAFSRFKRRKVDGEGGSASMVSFGPNRASADTVVFGAQAPDNYNGDSTICTEDPRALATLLDSRQHTGTLVIRLEDQAITRRVQRLKLNGWRIVWWPEEFDSRDESPQGCYLATHADECRGQEGS